MSCTNLGMLYRKGLGLKQDYKEASQFFEKSCNAGNAKGCYNLGVSYNNGQGVRQSYYNAKEYYGRACDLGLQEGCNKYKELNLKGY